MCAYRTLQSLTVYTTQRHYRVGMQRESLTGVVMNGRSAQVEGSRNDMERPWKNVIEREVKEQMRSVYL